MCMGVRKTKRTEDREIDDNGETKTSVWEGE